MPAIIRVSPTLRCPCGAPAKVFDLKIEPDEITWDCRRCHARLVEIELHPEDSNKADAP
jgi:hypothetical protein